MSKTIYLTTTIHFENELVVGPKDVYGYLVKKNKLIQIYQETIHTSI